jgi:predicted ATPase
MTQSVSIPQIESIKFKNFKALRDALLPLSRFTLIVGPNGSGKSTAMQAFEFLRNPDNFDLDEITTSDLRAVSDAQVEIIVTLKVDNHKVIGSAGQNRTKGVRRIQSLEFQNPTDKLDEGLLYGLRDMLRSSMVFSFDAKAIAAPVQLRPNIELESNGANLVGVLDNLRDREPERFVALNEELGRWLPEFDRILFETPSQGQRAFSLRTKFNRHPIKADDLSHGTLFALAFLTLAYLPKPPSIVCFEEPDRGIHPRLLREIRDGMYRLCYPEDYGDKRDPVQVIATTHSPYMLDLYKEHPEEVVIAQKDSHGTTFERLSDKPDYDEFLQEAPLGEVWFSGILGGVPAKP